MVTGAVYVVATPIQSCGARGARAGAVEFWLVSFGELERLVTGAARRRQCLHCIERKTRTTTPTDLMCVLTVEISGRCVTFVVCLI